MPVRVFTLSLREELVDKLTAMADAKGISRSAYIEDLCEAGIIQDELEVKILQQPLLLQAICKGLAEPGVLKSLAAAIGDELDEPKLRQFYQALKGIDGYQLQPPGRLRTYRAVGFRGKASKKKRGKLVRSS